MEGAHLGIVPRDSYESFAGFARPAYDIRAFDQLSRLRIEYLVRRTLGIDRIGVDGVSTTTERQAQISIDHIADREDHGIDIQTGSFVGGFG